MSKVVLDASAVLGLQVMAFDEAQAFQAGSFYPNTRHLGLSLGDRACLALAHQLQATAMTAARAWLKCEIDVAVELIR